MVAEHILAAIVLAFVAGWCLGNVAGRAEERRFWKARVRRARRLYLGGMRDW